MVHQPFLFPIGVHHPSFLLLFFPLTCMYCTPPIVVCCLLIFTLMYTVHVHVLYITHCCVLFVVFPTHNTCTVNHPLLFLFVVVFHTHAHALYITHCVFCFFVVYCCFSTQVHHLLLFFVAFPSSPNDFKIFLVSFHFLVLFYPLRYTAHCFFMFFFLYSYSAS